MKTHGFRRAKYSLIITVLREFLSTISDYHYLREGNGMLLAIEPF